MKAVLLVVVGLVAVSCVSSETTLGDSDRIIQASELPTNSIVPESKIQEIVKKIKDGEVSVIFKQLYHSHLCLYHFFMQDQISH